MFSSLSANRDTVYHMGDPAVSSLQIAINRFAEAGGFAKVNVDGDFGPKTREGTYRALNWIVQNPIRTGAQNVSTAVGLIAKWDETASSAKGIGIFLNQIADDLNLPHPAVPIASGSTPTAPSSTAPLPSAYHALLAQTSLVDRVRALPAWQKVALGVLSFLGGWWAYNRFVKKGA